MKREAVKGRMVQNGSGWAIEWTCSEGAWNEDHPVSIDFVIMGEDGEPIIDGAIKWDGCSNWREPDGNYFLLCGMRHVSNLNDALTMCYTVAGKYMPETVE